MPDPTYTEAIYLARLLIEPGENPEYERGMCELIGDLWATPEVELSERAEEVHRDMLAVDLNRPWNDQSGEEAARAARIEREDVARLLAQAEPVIVAIQALPPDDDDLDNDLASGWARSLMEANRLLKRYPDNTELQSLRTRLRRAMQIGAE